jgi:hypothetical protein
MRILAALFCLQFISIFSFAQCVPDTNVTHNVPGIYPDTIANLPHASVGQAYATTIQFKVKTDTVYLGLNVPIDSINILNVTGLPAGFSYTCTPSNCSFPGGSDACVYLQGPAPTAAMINTYPIVVSIRAFGVVLGTPTHLDADITGYKIVIDTTTGIGGIEAVNFSIGQSNPNPARDIVNIPVSLIRNSAVTISISNLLGKKIIQQTHNLSRGKNNITLDVHGLQPGIYLYSITDGKANVTRRMIISND